MVELLMIVEWTDKEGKNIDRDIRQYVSDPLFLAVPAGAAGLKLKLYTSVDVE